MSPDRCVVCGSMALGKSPRRGHDCTQVLISRAAKAERLMAEMAVRNSTLALELHRLQCEGVFALDRDPMDLMPAVDAYAEMEITSSRLREAIRAWLSGVSFRTKSARDWEQAG